MFRARDGSFGSEWRGSGIIAYWETIMDLVNRYSQSLLTCQTNLLWAISLSFAEDLIMDFDCSHIS